MRQSRRFSTALPCRAVFAGGLACGALLSVEPAHAQTVTLAPTGFDILREEERPDGEFPQWINRDDCLNDDDALAEPTRIKISPQIVGANTSQNVQVWVGAGADCTDPDQRLGTNARCWQVAENTAGTLNPLFVSPRDVVQGAYDVQSSNVDPNAIGSGTRASCDLTVQQTALTFYILLVDGGGEVLNFATWEDTSLDIIAPPPPSSATAGIGDQRLILDWKVSEGDERDDTQGFNFYCVPGDPAAAAAVGTGGGSATGGAAGAAGAAGATSSEPVASGPVECATFDLTPGEFPPEEFLCGSASGRAARDGETDNSLTNETTYAVGIAATDVRGNVGLLSELTCGTPKEVTTFFEGYRESGGVGGGGFCGIGGVPASGAFLTTLGAGALAWLTRRRRRRS